MNVLKILVKPQRNWFGVLGCCWKLYENCRLLNNSLKDFVFSICSQSKICPNYLSCVDTCKSKVLTVILLSVLTVVTMKDKQQYHISRIILLVYTPVQCTEHELVFGMCSSSVIVQFIKKHELSGKKFPQKTPVPLRFGCEEKLVSLSFSSF